jgi:hypothetical protein
VGNVDGEKPTWRRVLTVVSEVSGVVALVALALSKDARRWLAHAGEAIYPNGVIALLLLMVLGLVVRLVVVERRSAPGQQQERDRDLITDLMEVVGREAVVWMKQHDFGGPWNDEKLRPFFQLVFDWDEVEHRFHDRTLEERRQKLLAAIRVLYRESGQRAGIDGRGRTSISAWDDSPSRMTSEEREARKYESGRILNEAADEVVVAYDALVGRARDLDVLERRRSWSDP